MRPVYAEDALQMASCRILAMHADLDRVIFHHSGNERQGAKAGAKQRAKGQRAGWSDWVILWGPPLRALFIELKCGKNKPSSNQLAFLELSERLGAAFEVVYTLPEFVAALERHGVPAKTRWPKVF